MKLSLMNQLLEETLWSIVESFYCSIALFQTEYRQYDQQVKNFSEIKKIAREKLVQNLAIEEIESLLNDQKFSILNEHLRTLRKLCPRFFKEKSHDSLFSYYVSDIFHELSILRDEREKLLISGPQYMHLHEEEEYTSIMEEVHVFLPLKMLHIFHLFTKAKTELEKIIYKYNHSKILIRSIYLFGQDVIAPTYDNLDSFLNKFFPDGGSFETYLRAAHSFLESHFDLLAKEALAKAVAWKEAHQIPIDGELKELFDLLQQRIG